ncbi:MAG: 16S rRNA (guanine(527)-N(7))-methyltransferase RsmG [Aquiluna sp.]
MTVEFEQEPAFAAELFGQNIDKARLFTARLANDSETYGLLGPRELPRIWSRHVINSGLLAELVPDGTKVVDVGSGAGLPGIPMAIAQPNAHFTLVEPMERRSSWLEEVIKDLGLGNVAVVRARAEEVTESDFDFATARAVAALDKLLRLLTPLIRFSEHRTIIAMKGSKAPEEIAAAAKKLELLGFNSPEILTLGLNKAPETATVVRTSLK